MKEEQMYDELTHAGEIVCLGGHTYIIINKDVFDSKFENI